MFGQNATVLTTKDDGSKLLERSSVAATPSSNTGDAILLHPSEKNQTINGFGFAITYSSCYNLLKMSKADRTAFLKKTYSETEGLGVSYARISIGCNDFSSTEYSLCDERGLEHFRLYKDELEYVIPVLKEILAINPKMKIIASPWTCPKWMKVNSLTDLSPHDRWTDGHVNPAYYNDYAKYFLKFIQAFNAYGIGIYAVSPQNEPLNAGNCASTVMPWQEEADFVKVMAGVFKSNGLNTKIYVWDHNYDYGSDDQNDYPIKIYNKLGNNFYGADLVAGAAYHCYGGWNGELDDIYSKAPDKDLIFTEGSIGTWNNGRELNKRLMDDMNGISLDCVLKHCSSVMVWNLMLDTNMGPNLSGGCQTCFGAVDLNVNDYKTINYNSYYYIITHMSSVVKPGAVRINTSAPWFKGLSYAAFLNPDGSYSIVMLNQNYSDMTVPITDGAHRLSVTVPARGVVSCRWGTPTPAFNGTAMAESSESNIYTFKGSLTQGKAYSVSGREEMKSTSWYYDPDFFTLNSDGTYTFKAVSGEYEVMADFNAGAFRVFPIENGEPKTYKADGTGSVWAIGCKGIGKPLYATSGHDWWTGVSNDFCLAQVRSKIYQFTLTVGEQLDKNNVNFKFFHQPGWGGEFDGKSGSIYRITSNSDVFSVGDGSTNDGNITLKSGKTLKDGDTYVFTLNCSDPKNAVLSIATSAMTFNGTAMSTSSESGVYTYQGALTQGQSYTISGSDQITGEDWYYDTDFFTRNSDGTFTFKAISGNYEVMADLNKKCFRIFPIVNGSPATYQSDGTGAIWIIGNDGIGKPSYTANGQGWQTGVSHNMCMAQVKSKVYQISLTVGKELNKNSVNFKLFHQAGWGGEFDGKSGSSYRITTNSSQFIIGDGTNGKDDGNIYLRDGQTLTDGKTYIIKVDCSNPRNAIMTVNGDNTLTFNGTPMNKSGEEDVYTYQGTLTQGQSYAVSGSNQVTGEDWYCDTDFFTRNSDGTFTFKAISGNYEVMADFGQKCFRVFPIVNGAPATYQSDGTGAIWIIGNDGIGKPSYTANGQGWQTGVSHNMCMAQVKSKIYQISLTVGKELNKNSVNFKLFHQAGWGGEFDGKSGSSYRITTNSSQFLIGDGTNGKDNGNIYLRDGQTLTDGDTYILKVDCSNPQNAVLTVNGDNTLAFNDTPMTESSEKGVYIYQGQLTQGNRYTVSGSSEIKSANWYYDTDFLTRYSDDTFTFIPVSGNYEVMADFNKKCFRVFPIVDGAPATYQSDGTGAVWIIGSDGISKPSYAVNGQAWCEGVEHALCMSQISPKIYMITLTTGMQLDKNNVNFKFFHQPGWGGEFDGKNGSTYRISTNSSQFIIGDGTNWKDDGNLYIRDGQSLGDGVPYIFILNCADPHNTLLTITRKDSSSSYAKSFIDGATAIRNTENDVEDESSYYTLQGVKVNKPTSKGVYLHNGKKIVVK